MNWKNVNNNKENPEIPLCNFKQESLRKWFLLNKGKQVQVKVVTKPILTNEQKLKWVQWAEQQLIELSSDNPLYYAFLDKKWF